MSDVLQKLQEFRKEKERLRNLQEEKLTENAEATEKEEKESGKSWSSLTTTEPVDDDYEEHRWISSKVAIVLYIVGQALAAWIQFGAVFFILSLILFTYWNTGRRRRGEMSAYSVFNKNCERLAGSMTAEHFERDVLRQRR